MRSGADREGRRSAGDDACWRRRFFVLGGGIVVLAVPAWLFTMSAGQSSPASSFKLLR